MKPLHIARAQPGIYFNPVLLETIPVKDCLACEFTSKYNISTQQRGARQKQGREESKGRRRSNDKHY
jgi:hypothetical protein